MKALTKYLSRYAEPEVDQFAKSFQPSSQYQYVLCIPAFNETSEFLEQLIGDVELPGHLLIILIINAPEQAEHSARDNTLALLNDLKLHPTLWQDSEQRFSLHQYQTDSEIDLLLIDRCSFGREIPSNEGVGMARKIAADIACWMIQENLISSQWIHCTDADAKLPQNYFDTETCTNSSALIYPYQHIANTGDNISTAMALYELSLHYYVAGLNWAESPYAYHSLGSILAIDHRRYAQVRGFPKKDAAEDFYLLNKLNKIAPCHSLDKPLIKLSQRPSNRVPFGTGPAVKNIGSMQDPLHEYLFYDPIIFRILKHWLDSFDAIWQHKDQINTNSIDEYLSVIITETDRPDGGYGDLLLDGLKSLATSKAILHALGHSDNRESFIRHLNGWFDAFRTLKLIHYLRDHGLPSQPYTANLAQENQILKGENLNTWQRQSINHLIKVIEEVATNHSVQ